MPDYHLLGLGGLTSLVTEIETKAWGSQIAIRCLYDPTGELAVARAKGNAHPIN